MPIDIKGLREVAEWMRGYFDYDVEGIAMATRVGDMADALANLVSENERLRAAEIDSYVFGQNWAYLCGKLTAMEGKDAFPDVVPDRLRQYYDQGYRELTERKATCEHDWNVRIVTPEPRTELYCDRCGEVKP